VVRRSTFRCGFPAALKDAFAASSAWADHCWQARGKIAPACGRPSGVRRNNARHVDVRDRHALGNLVCFRQACKDP
jgi:hypothetical protein